MHEDIPTPIPVSQERTRTWMAKALTMLFFAIVLVVLGYFILGNPSDSRTTKVLAVVSTVTGTLGFAMGFYFGQSSGR